MSMIRVSDLSFSYEGTYDLIFDHVSFTIDTDWKLGLIGRNGRGKTTFLNLLMGKYEYRGTITSEVTFSYFPFQVKDGTKQTMEILKEICPDAMDWEILCETGQLNVAEDAMYRPFETLSQGEQTKTLLAALFLSGHGFPLIDEPTNHLDQNAREAVAEYLKRKKGFLLVSHDRILLDQCVDHILSLNRTDIEICKGNFSSWHQNRERQDEYERQKNERLKKEIHRLDAAAGQAQIWSDRTERSKKGVKNAGSKIDRGYVGHKAAKMMKRSKNLSDRREEALAEKKKLLHNIEENKSLKLCPLVCHSRRLVDWKKVSLAYGEKKVCRDVDLTIFSGDRLALCGKNGCGKSTILKAICGESLDGEGDRYLAKDLVISAVAQDASFLRGTLSDFAVRQEISDSLLRMLLRKLGLERGQFEKRLENLSEGQRKKVLLAASLAKPAHLYVWDEPLNYIDVISRIQIEELIEEYRPTMIFVEHDTVFTQKIATQIIDVDQFAPL